MTKLAARDEVTSAHRNGHGSTPQREYNTLLPSLGTTCYTSQRQHTPLEDELRALQVYVENLRAEENSLCERLCAVQSLRRAAEQKVEQCESILHAPIRRLPAELLCEIFLYLWPRRAGEVKLTNGRPLFPNFLSPAFFPVPFVCSLWRRLASSMPRLQPRLCLDVTDPGALTTPPHPPPAFDLADAPRMFLRMHILGQYRKNGLPHRDVLEPLAKHSAHWREVMIECTSWPALRFVGTELALPQLRKATVVLPRRIRYVGIRPEDEESWWDEAMASDNPWLFDQAPDLRDLVLINKMDEPISSLPFTLTWHQLTSLTVNPYIAPDLYVEIISQCTSLRSFTLREAEGAGGTVWDAWLPPTQRTCVFRGDKLSLKITTLRNVKPFLKAVAAPNLTQLHIGVGAIGESIQPILDFLDRSRCGLTRLKLWWAMEYPSTVEFEELLGRVQSLEYLQLRIGTAWKKITSPTLVRSARALLDSLCIVREEGKLPGLRVLKIATVDDLSDVITGRILPAFVYDASPLHELWLSTPIHRDTWEHEVPRRGDMADMYGLRRSYGMAKPIA
ncbi:uncharacterized protein SCHCODRAFT_02313569 [Schizophyllum commune H4-8]|nr:uncharacterized protein SCHCODRAFT_02313569 [Schizophyllum commune H4-8]KAI5891237.1 hypothetical protein SCHCODRAFT_02313569 [Schizophyllum commune H4-8]